MAPGSEQVSHDVASLTARFLFWYPRCYTALENSPLCLVRSHPRGFFVAFRVVYLMTGNQ